MNLKLRFKNKTTLVAIITCVIAFVYQILGLLGVVPSVTEAMTTDLVGIVINVLVALGIIVDPTTAGIKDTTQVMDYDHPRVESFNTSDPVEDPEVEILDEDAEEIVG